MLTAVRVRAQRSGSALCRKFSQTSVQRSAWPLGHDVSGEVRNGLPPVERAIVLGDLQVLKDRGEPIAMLTAYDYASALSIRSAPVDICLVGDSLANVALGLRTTHPLTLESMIHHVKAVARGIRHPILNQSRMPPVPLLIADVPMGYVEISIEEGMRAATTLIKHGGADGVKIEGGREVAPLIERLAAFGIPVMSHIGLQPQRSTSGSALHLAGRTAIQATEMLGTAQAMQRAGAFACLLECIPARVAEAITKRLLIPTIGIGAGAATDGQVLVTDDVLGECNSPLHVLAGLQGHGEAQEQQDSRHDAITSAVSASLSALPRPADSTPGLPRFVRNFVAPLSNGSSLGALRMAAVQAYVGAVKDRSFPSDTESYKMNREELAAFKVALQAHDKAST